MNDVSHNQNSDKWPSIVPPGGEAIKHEIDATYLVTKEDIITPTDDIDILL